MPGWIVVAKPCRGFSIRVVPWVFGLVTLWAATAVAAPARVDWPTFFRLGPSTHYEVVDELLRGTMVDVRSCTDQWCLVQYGRNAGYVEQWTLNSDAFPASATAAGPPCFETVRNGYGKGEVLQVCRR